MLRVVLLTCFFGSSVHAISLAPFIQSKADINQEKAGWEIDLQRIALNFTQSSLTNQKLYASFSDSNLKGNSQLSLQFFFTLNANYYAPRFVIFNSMQSEYGFTQIKQNSANAVRNKNLDKILFATDYTQRMWDFDWRFEAFEIGPYMRLSYQTEFSPSPTLGRRHILNYMFGAKLFDGRYIKTLYFNLFGEHDFNPQTLINALGIETGLALEYKFNRNVRWTYTMNFKKYLFNTQASKIQPDYQLLLETRIEARLFKSLSIAPLLRYYILKAETISVPASSFILGVSLNFSKVLLPPRKALKDYQFLY